MHEATVARLPSARATAWAVAGATALVLALGGAHDFTHIDEHRYAEVSRVMAEPGGDWLVPHVNGKVYDDKPPLFFWMAAAAQRAGVALPAAAILPSQLGALAALLALFGIARRTFGLRAAIVAAALLGGCVRFAGFAGRANLDALLTGFVATAIYCAVRGEEAQDGGRPARGWYALACLCAGLGVLAKGPLGIAIPAIAIGGARVLEGRARSLRSPWIAAALGIALAPIALWLVAAGLHGGWAYVQTLVFRHAVEHSLGRVLHESAPWTYLRIFPSAFLPGAVLLPAAILAFPRARPLARGEAIALAWLGGGFVLLSLVAAKRHHYLMPIYPGAALLTARLFSESAGAALRERPLARRLFALGRWALVVWGAVIAASLLAALAVAFAGGDPPSALAAARALASLWRALAAAPPSVPAFAAALGAASLVGAALAAQGNASARAAGIATIALVAGVVQARVVEPALAPQREKRAFLERVETLVGDAALADYGGIDFAANWTLRRDVVPVLGSRADARRFFAAHPPGEAFLLADRRALERAGMPPHARVVLEWPREGKDDLLLIGPED